MKVYVDTYLKSLAVRRVVDALTKRSPSYIEIVMEVEKADLVVLHVNGRLEGTTRYIESINRPYAIVQYTFKSTLNPEAEDWMPMWNGAELVWSYLYLEGEFNFYHAPLGVDSKVFYPRGLPKVYTVLTSGEGYLAESVREVMMAGRRLDAPVAHLGPDLKKEGVDYFSGLSDDMLASLYSSCDYVSGLRRNEGFELPAAEGLMCGARPILFDVSHYKSWYDGLAVFIPETNRDQIVEDVYDVLRQDVKPVEASEIKDATERFNWDDLVKEFWSYI
jgi:hypothetical protein